jgi:hypothetical protein
VCIVAVEAVIEPGDKRSNGEESNATVVKFDKELANELVIVAVDGVVGEGEAHADNGPSKEGHENSLKQLKL